MQNNIISGLFVGQNLVVLKEAASTSDFLKQMLSNSKPVAEGTVIMAESQYAGRGQQQNRWHSQPGKNLTFSLLLKPSFILLQQQFHLNQAVSVGVTEALRQITGLDVYIKWPNDIYIDSKKLGGILIENIVHGSRIDQSVIGIGLNINQETFPAELPDAVSLKQLLHTDYDLTVILAEICTCIERRYLNLRAGLIEDLKTAYLQSLYGLNRLLQFTSGGYRFSGTITGVTNGGLLILNTENGQKEFNLKEIQFLQK